MKKLLIIEDEVKVANIIKQGFEENGFTADVAYDGTIGLKMLKNATAAADAIILDVNLPGMNGYEVAEKIRESNPRIPILMLTALGNIDDKIAGFESGADDYLLKPFEFKELLIRINTLIKRNTGIKDSRLLKIADLELNLDTKIVKRNGTRFDLTAKEFGLLEYLVKNKGKVVSRAAIAQQVWDLNFDTGTNVIDVYVNFLRKKIDNDPSKKLIHTVVGMGYILREEYED
jgi:DNA-binding response OmpR family regulator